MRLLVTGSSGLIGSELVKRLREEGHEVRRFDLRPAEGQPARWGRRYGLVNVESTDYLERTLERARWQ